MRSISDRFGNSKLISLYEDKGQPEVKWRKSHALLEAAGEFPEYSGIRSVYAPSASGIELGIGGMVFSVDPTTQPVQFLGTGSFNELIAGNRTEESNRVPGVTV